MSMIRISIVGTVALLSGPMLGVFGQTATAEATTVTTLTFFEHDTSQTSLDLGSRGPGPGDQFLFAGDLFDHAGGTKVGHTAGQCTTLSGNTDAGDVLCTQSFVLDGGQLVIQGAGDSGAIFVRGETVRFAIVGGTGIYSDARGDGTVKVPPDVPNETDANYVLNVVIG
jgi:hypothetical protein